MGAQNQSASRLLIILRRGANIVGTSFILFVLAMNFLDIPEDPPPATTADAIQLDGMLAVALGILLAWRWSLAGGLAILLGYAVFESVMLIEHQRIAGRLFLLFLPLAAIHLAYWQATRRREDMKIEG